MKQDFIKDVIQGMLPYLNNAQNEKLQEVLKYTLAKYEVTENQNKEKYSELNFVELFLSAKRIEGCSEKSLKYYKATIEAMLCELKKDVKHIVTDDIRGYLTEYQEKKKSSKVTIDNIRRILCESNKPNMDEVHEGEMIAGKPHLFFWDENFVNVFLHSGIDYLIWYAPYKLLRTSQGIFELPKVVMFDCKTENYDNLIKYNEERICSSEL